MYHLNQLSTTLPYILRESVLIVMMCAMHTVHVFGNKTLAKVDLSFSTLKAQVWNTITKF